MGSNHIVRMFYLVRSCQNNLDTRWNHKFDEQVENACLEFCNDYKINITHGSAFKELRHKTYYYKNRCITSIIDDGVDLYSLHENKLVSDSEIVTKLIQNRGTRKK